MVVEEASAVMQMDTKNLKALYRRGQAYAAMGRNSMAESDLAAAQQVNPQVNNPLHPHLSLLSPFSVEHLAPSESQSCPGREDGQMLLLLCARWCFYYVPDVAFIMCNVAMSRHEHEMLHSLVLMT